MTVTEERTELCDYCGRPKDRRTPGCRAHGQTQPSFRGGDGGSGQPHLIDAYTSVAHYAEHIQPILDALPDDVRGKLYAPRNVVYEIGRAAVGHAPAPSHMPLLVGTGDRDLVYGRRPKVLVQHGAGQTYQGVESPSFAGGPGHEPVNLFICPSSRVAKLELDRYPGAQVAVVGCPKLDAWLKVPQPRNDKPVIAVTFHWNQPSRTIDGDSVPEAGWAWPTWRDAIAELAKHATVLGHAHPRARRELEGWWASIGVEYVPRAVDLLPRADVLVLDNSSLGFEWAALDRPTVWLRGLGWSTIEHGPPRFGTQLPGPELGTWALDRDPVREILDAVGSSIERFTLARAEFRDLIYDGLIDGKAAQRAAEAVLQLVP